MTINELQAKCQEYREYKRLADEAKDLMDGIADEIKAYMTESGQDKTIAGQYKISYTETKRTDIDKQALKDNHPEVFYSLIKETFFRRFAVT